MFGMYLTWYFATVDASTILFFPFRLRALIGHQGWNDDELLSLGLIIVAHHDESSSIPPSHMSPSAWNSTEDFGSPKCPPE